MLFEHGIKFYNTSNKHRVIYMTLHAERAADQTDHYAPNFGKVERAYCFRLLRASSCPFKIYKDTVLKFHIWIPHQKIIDTYFLCLDYLPLWSNVPLKGS